MQQLPAGCSFHTPLQVSIKMQSKLGSIYMLFPFHLINMNITISGAAEDKLKGGKCFNPPSQSAIHHSEGPREQTVPQTSLCTRII